MVLEYLLWAIELAIVNNKDPGSWSQRLENSDALCIINKRDLIETNIFAIGSKEVNKLAIVCTPSVPKRVTFFTFRYRV